MKWPREVALGGFRDPPAQRQSPAAAPRLVEDAHHQGHAAAPHDAAVHHEHERAGRQALDQRPRVGLEERLGRDRLVLEEAGEALDAALTLAASGTATTRHFTGDGGQVALLAPDDAAD